MFACHKDVKFINVFLKYIKSFRKIILGTLLICNVTVGPICCFNTVKFLKVLNFLQIYLKKLELTIEIKILEITEI